MILLDQLARPVVGHRGNRAHSPENTIQSLLEAVKLGADAVEFDVRVTHDGVVVLMHDATLERTTDGRGLVSERTFAELKALDAGAQYSKDGISRPWRGRGVTIPSIDEVFESLPKELPLIIELKTPDAAPLVRSAIARHGALKRVIVAGFDALSTSQLRDAGFALGASQKEIASLLLPSLMGWRIGAPHFQAMCIPSHHRGIPLPLKALKKTVEGYGVVTHVWTVNDPEKAMLLWQRGVNGIISDDPKLILEARGR